MPRRSNTDTDTDVPPSATAMMPKKRSLLAALLACACSTPTAVRAYAFVSASPHHDNHFELVAEEPQTASQQTTAYNQKYTPPTNGFFPMPGTKYGASNSPLASSASKSQDLELNGDSIGEGKYLITKSASMSTSGKSAILKAFRHDDTFGEPVVVKMSKNREQLQRESDNFRMITRYSSSPDLFVQVYDFLPCANLKTDRSANDLEEFGAIVMEQGDEDLYSFIFHRGPLRGEWLRNTARQAAMATKAIHDCGLVWSELKANNFVTQDGGNTIKAIDLESAVPVGKPNRDYTPQMVPPEFARYLKKRPSGINSMAYSFDVWSYGMMLYEMATGTLYFQGADYDTVVGTLDGLTGDARIEDGASTNQISDPQVIDLIRRCLRLDPAQRPTMDEVLAHEFFSNAGRLLP